MSLETVVASPQIQKILPIDEAPARPADVLPPPSPEQVQAIDAALVEDQESDAVAGMIGLWTSTVLLHDLAVEHLQRGKDEDEEEPRKPRQKPEERE